MTENQLFIWNYINDHQDDDIADISWAIKQTYSIAKDLVFRWAIGKSCFIEACNKYNII